MYALEVDGLHAWYGESHVVHGASFNVRRGEVVTLLGRNGAGRTSSLRALLGLTGRRTGSVKVFSRQTMDMPTHQIARLGLGYCPEERGIFASLTCEENLLMLPRLNTGRHHGLRLDEIYDLFPNLAERRNSPGTRLSGGEQQMLAIARILLTGADILLLDEISEGLAPAIVQELGQVIGKLRDGGFAVVLVEQNFHFAAPLSDRLYVMEHGRVIDTFSANALPRKMEQLHELLGV
jgi:branched-chain amino acid transport system ATP-binding protein